MVLYKHFLGVPTQDKNLSGCPKVADVLVSKNIVVSLKG